MPTILHRLERWAESDPEAPAQRHKKNGQWETTSVRELRDRVYYLALFLESRGMGTADVGCIFSPNRPEWVHLDLATLLVGAKSAGIYPNSVEKEVQYVLAHTESRFVCVAGKPFYLKMGSAGVSDQAQLVLSFDDDGGFHPKALTYAQALDEGKKLAKQRGTKSFSDFLKKIDPQSGAILIYTSGTTGNPKGALLSHDNLVFTSDLASRHWKLPYANGSLFSFLPLCHVAEKLQSIGVGISQRYVVSYASKFEAVAEELPQVQPKLLLCVPRLWEKMMEGVMHKIHAASAPKKKLADWALNVGAQFSEIQLSGKTPSLRLWAEYLAADQLVLSKIRQALGLAQAQALASGAAPLPAHVSRWFRSLGLEILEDYGQTESTGVICMTEPGVESAGTVGKPVEGTQFKIAPDGEILTRGRHVFLGYLKNESATQEALSDGWLHTGDLGEINSRGQVQIRGRKKEILKTSGGKMIAPVPIEDDLKSRVSTISQVCMVGDNRKYLSALITLTEDRLKELRHRKLGALDQPTISDSDVLSEIKKGVDALNRTLSGYEQIKKFSVLSREFSIAEGEMTPTLKMKRAVIEKKFADLIEGMYESV
jgi:long-chain acyl-CoA synthetase